MLKTPVIHPTIMEVLARSGHFAQVVIADGNLPVAAMTGPNSTTVHLNFRPGLLDAVTVLEGLLEICPIQGAIVMEKPAEANAEIHLTYKKTTWRRNMGRDGTLGFLRQNQRACYYINYSNR